MSLTGDPLSSGDIFFVMPSGDPEKTTLTLLFSPGGPHRFTFSDRFFQAQLVVGRSSGKIMSLV
jgi:hypothetical protein